MIPAATNKVLAADPLPVLIINQVRGVEDCCESGDADIFQVVNNIKQNQKLPIAWTLRYDVLTDDQFVKSIILPQKQTLGILLEVTPQLASKSGVLYKGGKYKDDWKEARNIFLIGYSRAERKKLIDTVFTAFYERFRYYPVVTAAWMIDSWSLQYLSLQYGVKLHEITKEQYETDDYTLYGGIFNIPYYPSYTHPLIPYVSGSDKLDVMLVRQTVSDIEKNYGSYSSLFTSQPNDYLKQPNGNFNYFKKLLTNAGSQQGLNKFALLGLENSNEWQSFKDEFLSQLQYVVDQEQSGEIITYAPGDYIKKMSGVDLSGNAIYLRSPQFPANGVLWYFGETYRVLIENRQENLVLSDLRIYPQNLTDPYLDLPAKTSRAYEVVPYLLDSSQQFVVNSQKTDQFSGHAVRTDNGVERFGIKLGEGLTGFEKQDKTIILKSDKQEVRLEPGRIVVTGFNPQFLAPLKVDADSLIQTNSPQFFLFDRHVRFFVNPSVASQQLQLGWEGENMREVVLTTMIKTGASWEILPDSKLSQDAVNALSAIFQLDRTLRPFEPHNSIFYWPKTSAIAGKNPIRLFISPKNILDRPVIANSLTIKIDNSLVEENPSQDKNIQMKEFFVDFESSQSAAATITLKNTDTLIETQSITFFTNCKIHLLDCLGNSHELKGYLGVLVQTKKEELGKVLIQFRFQAGVFLNQKLDELKLWIRNKILSFTKLVNSKVFTLG